MTNAPKITVIIPTRERCDVLESSLRTVTSQNYENLEIIVSDNYSSDATADVIRRANDKRIRYINTGKRVSMSHNWEFALSHVSDGWVTFIGDDDGLLPGSLSTVAKIAISTGTRAIRSDFCTYDWPSVADNVYGQLIVPMSSGLEVRNSRLWLSKVMRGREKYNQLPMIYTGGYIHMSILRELRERMGSYFLSISPDVYSAIAISSVIDSYIYSREPLAISGTSRHSTGNSSFSTGRGRNPSPKIQFNNEENLPFHGDMPLCADGSCPPSLQVCAYEAYLQSSSLRDGSSDVTHDQQLAIILATAGKHRPSIEAWGVQFAEMHNINYETSLRSAVLKRALLQSCAAGRKLAKASKSVITDTVPVMDIFEASIAAGTIRCSPGKLDTLRYLVNRLIKLGQDVRRT